MKYGYLEEWPGYRVDKQGRVWSSWWRSNSIRRHRLRQWWQMSSTTVPVKGYRYLVVVLINGKKKCRMAVHKFVLTAFSGPPGPGQQARHLNGNSFDNRLVNLKWGTAQENMEDIVRHGRRRYGERNPSHKLTEKDVLEILECKKRGESPTEVAKRYSVSDFCIGCIYRGKTWKYLTSRDNGIIVPTVPKEIHDASTRQQ